MDDFTHAAIWVDNEFADRKTAEEKIIIIGKILTFLRNTKHSKRVQSRGYTYGDIVNLLKRNDEQF